MIGVVSFFADFTYEGSRSITGAFLQTLGGPELLSELWLVLESCWDMV